MSLRFLPYTSSAFLSPFPMRAFLSNTFSGPKQMFLCQFQAFWACPAIIWLSCKFEPGWLNTGSNSFLLQTIFTPRVFHFLFLDPLSNVIVLHLHQLRWAAISSGTWLGYLMLNIILKKGTEPPGPEGIFWVRSPNQWATHMYKHLFVDSKLWRSYINGASFVERFWSHVKITYPPWHKLPSNQQIRTPDIHLFFWCSGWHFAIENIPNFIF